MLTRFYHMIITGYCAFFSTIILGPLLFPGYWLFNDAVSTPRIYLTAETYGVGDIAPRAVPQDWLLSILNYWIDGGTCVKVLTWIGIFLFGLASAILVEYFLGKKYLPTLAACTFAMANPYVNERLAQGQWSLLVGLGAGMMAMVISLIYLVSPTSRLRNPLFAHGLANINSDIGETSCAGSLAGRKRNISMYWPLVIILLSLANLTISSGVITLLIFFPVIMIFLRAIVFSHTAFLQLMPGYMQNKSNIVVGAFFICLFVWTALPWLWSGVLSGSKSSVSLLSAELFRFHIDHGGAFLTALSLGGIWNHAAWSVFQNNAFMAIMQALLILCLVSLGYFSWIKTSGLTMWKDRSSAASWNSEKYIYQRLFLIVSSIISGLMLLAVAASARKDITKEVFTLIHNIPGSGIWRDSQKFLAVTIPLLTILIAWAVDFIVSLSVLAAGGVWLLILLCFADIFWGGLGSVRARRYPADFAIVSNIINAHPAPVISLPEGIIRRYDFMQSHKYSTISLDPFPRMLNAPVRTSGEIQVDGHSIDRIDSRGAKLEKQVLSAKTPADVEKLPIGWIIVNKSPGNWGNFPQLARQLHPIYSGKVIKLYSIFHIPNTSSKSFFGSSDAMQHVAIKRVLPVYMLWLLDMVVAAVFLGWQGIVLGRLRLKRKRW